MLLAGLSLLRVNEISYQRFFMEKIKEKLKKTCGEGDKVTLRFGIPVKPPWGSVLISLPEAAGSPQRRPPPSATPSAGAARLSKGHGSAGGSWAFSMS